MSGGQWEAPAPAGPSRAGYVVAAAIALLGVIVGVAGIVVGFRSLSDQVDAFQRVSVPGSGTVTFGAAGDLTIYYEARGASQSDGGTPVPPLQIRMVRQPGGDPLPIQDYGGSVNYSVGGHEGTAVATVRVDRPGTYELTGAANLPAGTARLAVGKSLGGVLARTLLPMLVIFVALGGAAVLAIVTAVRRRRARAGTTV